MHGVTYNDIHIIIDGLQILVVIMRVAWEDILSIFHSETVFYLQKKYCNGGDNKTKQKKKIKINK